MPPNPSRNSETDPHASMEKASNEKHEHVSEVAVVDVDTAAGLVYGAHGELDPVEAARVRRKIDYHILPLMCILYWIQFMDKTTLGSSAILGIRTATHLTTDQFNWLGTIFYLSYLAFEFPQNLALQHFPVAKWMSINILVWGVALCAHAACTNFGGLMAVRFILGMCEGSITAGFMIVSSMFYTRTEQTQRVGYWFLMNGTAQIIAGFISFGTLHIKGTRLEPWQWLMIITGLLTFINAVLFWLFFPDSPTSAWFLTPEERTVAIMRLKQNQTGVENKQFKQAQMVEALVDPKTWLFALFSVLSQIPNSLVNQGQIIVASFGFTILQTTLLSCVPGVIEIVTIWTGVIVVARTGSRAWVAVLYYIPNILGTILVTTLPWSNKVGLVCSAFLTGVGTTGFVIALAWISNVTAGHTKRITTNAIMLGAYGLGNALGPFMWQAKYQPRDRVPWTIIGICFASCMGVLLVIRWLLKAENSRRDAEPPRDDGYDDVYIEILAKDGSGAMEKVKVDKEFLDLTDRENHDFRYVY